MKKRLYVGGVFAGVAAILVLVMVVFAFGRNDPSPPSLRDNPNEAIPGEILYLDEDHCFTRAAASGASERKLACIPQYYGSTLYWLAENTAGIVVYDPRGAVLFEVDLATGATKDTGRVLSGIEKRPPAWPYGGAYAPDGTFAYFDEKGDFYHLVDGVRTKIGEFDVPEYNIPQVVTWSPDSQWLLVQYYARHDSGPQLWIISRDAKTRGTLSKDVGPPHGAWKIEGVGVQPTNP